MFFCVSFRGLGVQTDFVRSVTLDSWKEDQIAIMKAGGNAKCLEYFEEQKMDKDLTLKEKYTTDVATHYKKMVAAAAKGEAEPTTIRSSTPNEQTASSKEADLILSDPSLTYSQAMLPSLIFLLEFLGKSASPVTVVAGYLVLGGIYYYTHLKVLAVIGFLPILLFLLFWAKLSRTFVTRRLPAFKSAHNLLLERIQSGRAKRTRDGHHIYLPKPSSEKKKKYGMVFFPGALVNHTAYSPLACKLSDAEMVVVVMSLEPTRFSSDSEMCKKMALLIMYEVLSISDVNVDEWILAGHSAGAAVAMSLAAEMKPGVSKLILCGIGSDHMRIKTLRDAAIDVLVMHGSNDGLVNSCTEQEKQHFRSVLPPETKGGKGKTEYITIDGGNHAGFGHYGPQSYPRSDGERTITLDQQQDTLVQKTLELLSAKIEGSKQD